VPITQATYQHWMAIGAATVEMPKPTGALPKALTYVPPQFTACAAQLKASSPSATAGQLRSRCRKTYEGIRSRILNFLITGSWLRQQASGEHIAVSRSEVQKTLATEQRAEGAAQFRRLEKASRQGRVDLEYAAERQLLSTKLLERFEAAHRGQSAQAAIAAFNRSLTVAWTPRTICEPGYAVKDCRRYKR